MKRPLSAAENVSRRYFLSECGVGLGRAAALGLLAAGSPRPAMGAALSPRLPSLEPRAKSVIHLFMAGAPSQLELFDYKPKLAELEGQPLPPSIIGNQRYAFIQPDAAVMGPRFPFARHGESRAEISAAAPHTAQIADEICILRSVHTDQFNHAPAQIFLSSGFSQPGRPSFGSWVLYGLGAMSENLPAYMVMSTGSGLSGGSALWSSGFMPNAYEGVRLRNAGDPILHVSSPEGIDADMQRDSIDVINELNRQRYAAVGDPEIAARIESFEMAARLQTSAPELTDLTQESQTTLDMYGYRPDETPFARACLLARRMVERGVRFISVFHEGWDAHQDVEGNVRSKCAETDQASAALVRDLKQRGLLDETLVIWGGEFGRTPMVESNPALGRKLGRDHHPQAFSMWLAGGGVRPGITYGATDEFGFHPVEDPIHVQDLQATLLRCLGIDHEHLAYRRQGLEFRLTGVEPRRVVEDVLL